MILDDPLTPSFRDRMRHLSTGKWRIATDYQIDRIIAHIESEQGTRDRNITVLNDRFDNLEARLLKRLYTVAGLIIIFQGLSFLLILYRT